MIWRPGYEEIITLAFLVAIGLYLWELSKGVRIRGVLREALRRSDRYGLTGRDTVRLDRNQAAELLGEDTRPEIGQKFTGKFDPTHPAMRTPTKRRKLGGKR